MGRKLVAFSKFLSYSVGGAELSTVKIIEKECCRFDVVHVVSIDIGETLYMENNGLKNSWRRKVIKPPIKLNLMNYLEFFLSYLRVYKFFKLHYSLTDELHTYGFLAPAALLGFTGKKRIYLRSESDLGINVNYHTGYKRVGKFVKDIIEYPFYLFYLRKLRQALENAEVIANSRFMAKLCCDKFGVQASVHYPEVDISNVEKDFKNFRVNSPGEYIVFVGEDELKGLSVVLKIASSLRNETFVIYSRKVTVEFRDRNLIWRPRVSDRASIYAEAKVVIVPSQWLEAYGRVAREAYLLGVPVLVSGIGGLPEAVNEDKDKIVVDYKNPNAWQKSLARIIQPVK